MIFRSDSRQKKRRIDEEYTETYSYNRECLNQKLFKQLNIVLKKSLKEAFTSRQQKPHKKSI